MCVCVQINQETIKKVFYVPNCTGSLLNIACSIVKSFLVALYELSVHFICGKCHTTVHTSTERAIRRKAFISLWSLPAPNESWKISLECLKCRVMYAITPFDPSQKWISLIWRVCARWVFVGIYNESYMHFASAIAHISYIVCCWATFVTVISTFSQCLAIHKFSTLYPYLR